jgi:phosphoglycolate phosphatase-like HAD superfamily hydrolase
MNIVVVDFAGTLVKAEAIEEANLLRFRQLGIPEPTAPQHKRMHATKVHYDLIRKAIEKDYAIADAVTILHQQNNGAQITLSGKQMKTNIMTDLFRNAMYAVAAKQGKDVYPEGLLAALQAIKKKGYALAIVSGVRTDIISGMLAITKCPVTFDYIYGQDAILSRDDNAAQYRELAKQGTIYYVIGDKLSDLLPAKQLGAKAVFVTWGHAEGGEDDVADYIVKTPKELTKIV